MTSNLGALIMPEPEPKGNELPSVWNMVIEDMAARDEFGFGKYHMHLQPYNGRDALKDAYQEALDMVVYLRQLIYERDNHDPRP